MSVSRYVTYGLRQLRRHAAPSVSLLARQFDMSSQAALAVSQLCACF